ncbi:MAG: Ig-like domain-containing protein [Patescibacteria group bacterium]
MRIPLKPAALAAILSLMSAALPAAAAPGDLVSIALRDFNHDGRIDRAVVAVANPSGSSWSLQDASGFVVAYDGAALAISKVAVTSPSSDPALVEIVLDAANLPLTTSAAKFEVSYAGAGLAAFAPDDASAAVTEKDEASPILIASNPAAGSIDVYRSANITLTFSEDVDPASLVPASARNPGAWSFSSAAAVVTVGHFPYANNADESFGIAAKDLAGNALVAGPYPNPFAFRTTDDTTPSTRADNVFALTVPGAFAALPAAGPAHLAWYTNLADIASVRLSYSTDAGASYAPIATAPVTQGVHVWYPPQISSAFQLRAEGLNAAGVPVASSFVAPVSTVGAWAPEPVTTAPSGAPDTAAPALTAPAVIDRFDATARSAKMTWTTDEPSRFEVSYGSELNFSGRAESAALTTSHEITLTGLTPGALHQARITSFDAKGNAAVSRDYWFVFLREGDLIKGEGPAVYWYKAGKRSAFPHLDVYRSWFGEDFSKIVRVYDTQLGTIPLGGNVKMKEGVYLIKIQSDPKTYAVEPNGVLRWVQTEEHARQLYGAAWAKRVRDVDVSLFTDYAIGAALVSGERPAGYAN